MGGQGDGGEKGVFNPPLAPQLPPPTRRLASAPSATIRAAAGNCEGAPAPSLHSPGLCIKPPPGALLPPSPRRRGRGGKVLSQQGHLGSQRVVNKPCYYYAASPRARRRRRWQQQHEGRAAAAAFVSFVFSLLENGI